MIELFNFNPILSQILDKLNKFLKIYLILHI